MWYRKIKALKAVNKVPLNFIGNKDANMSDIMQEGSAFVAQCYGQSNKGSSENRRIIWIKRQIVPKKSSKAPTLKSLPPTDESLKENIKRAHYNAALWYNCITGIPPQMNPCDYGWDKKLSVQSCCQIAPEGVLKITHCK